MTHARTVRIGLAALAAAAALALVACGDDEGAGPAAADDYQARASQICRDGTQEAVALPLPTSSTKAAGDAAARAEIVTTVRDGLAALGSPSGQEAEAAAMLDEFAADIEQLEAIAASLVVHPEQEGEVGNEIEAGPLDESAGQAALELGLTDCAAFSNAIARTP